MPVSYTHLDVYKRQGYASRPLSVKNQFIVLIEYAKKYLPESSLGEFFAVLRKDYDRTKTKGQVPEELSKFV